jgi:hypothetical protein
MPDTRTLQFTWSPLSNHNHFDWYLATLDHTATIYSEMFQNGSSMVATIRPVIDGQASLSYEQSVFPSVEEAKAWCEAMILTGAV